jgi:alpha-L-fucosidase
LLATGEKLHYQNSGKNVVIDLPEYDPNHYKPEDHYAYVFKITNGASSP